MCEFRQGVKMLDRYTAKNGGIWSVKLQHKCFLNLRQVAATSSELRMAETTQMR
jgi:hypothetical protein